MMLSLLRNTALIGTTSRKSIMKLSRLAIAPLLLTTASQARAAYSTKDLKTSSGAPIPMIGIGTWQSDPEKVTDAVYSAIKAGYRHIDCAAEYGNEVEVGKGINRAIEDGITKREDLWITSKLWNDRWVNPFNRGNILVL